MGSRQEFTRILGLDGFRVETITWDGDGPTARVRIGIEQFLRRDQTCSPGFGGRGGAGGQWSLYQSSSAIPPILARTVTGGVRTWGFCAAAMTISHRGPASSGKSTGCCAIALCLVDSC